MKRKLKQIKIGQRTDNLFKMDFPELTTGKLTYDDVVKTCYIAWRKMSNGDSKRK